MSQVKDIFDAVKHRLPDRDNLYPAINSALRLINKRLFYHKSSLVRGDLSVSFTADSSSASLPSDYWGLLENPYISGKTYSLDPIPSQETKLSYTTNSIPIYFEVIGFTLYLYPGTSSAITMKGGYWTKPTKVTSPLDTVPYNELFDDVIQEALLEIYSKDKNPMLLKNYINEEVDSIIPYIERTSPKRTIQAVNYEQYATGEGWL